jgi:hypothetical protein
MKRDPDFWFWLSAMAAFVAMYLMALTYQLNFYSEWFLGLFLVVLLLAAGYMGKSLLTGRKGKGVVTAQGYVGDGQAARKRRFRSALLSLACTGGLLLFVWLDSVHVVPRLLGAAFSIVLLGLWLWYELVGSKSEEVER